METLETKEFLKEIGNFTYEFLLMHGVGQYIDEIYNNDYNFDEIKEEFRCYLDSLNNNNNPELKQEIRKNFIYLNEVQLRNYKRFVLSYLRETDKKLESYKLDKWYELPESIPFFFCTKDYLDDIDTLDELIHYYLFWEDWRKNVWKEFKDSILIEFEQGDLPSIQIETSNNEFYEQVSFKNNTQKIAWLKELGVLDNIMTLCKDGSTYNCRKAANVIASFTEIDAEILRKCLSSIFQVGADKKNDPMQNPKNKLFVTQLAETFRLNK